MAVYGRLSADEGRVMYTSKGAVKTVWEGIRHWEGKKYRQVKDVTDDYTFDRKGPVRMNTLCPKVGASQWSCSHKECICHLKGSLPKVNVTCVNCGNTDLNKCIYFYRHAHDKVPDGCLLTLGGP